MNRDRWAGVYNFIWEFQIMKRINAAILGLLFTFYCVSAMAFGDSSQVLRFAG